MNNRLLMLSALVLGLTPLTGPASADAAMSGMDMSRVKTAKKPASASLSVTATINPAAPKSGDNALDLMVMDAAGKPITGLKLTSSVAMTSMDMGTTHPAFAETGGGHYKATVNFSMEGPWRVVVRDQAAKIAVLDFQPGSKTPWKPLQIKVTPGTPSAAPTPIAKAPVANAMAGMDMNGSKDAAKPSAMAGMNMSGVNNQAKPDPVAGMDMSSKGGGMTGMTTGIADMKTAVIPELKETGTYVATGDENWKMQTGFGHNAPMVGMMNQMMVGGSGMEGMKMAPMNMKFGEQNYTKPVESDAGDSMAGMDMGSMDMGSKDKAADAGKSNDMKSNDMKSNDMKSNDMKSNDMKSNDMKSNDMKSNDMKGMKMDAPPASGAPAPSTPVNITATATSAPKAGDNPLAITLTDAQGEPVTGATITTSVAMTSMDMGTTHPAVTEKGSGNYTTTATFSMVGPWRVQVKVTPPGQKPTTKSFDFTAK